MNILIAEDNKEISNIIYKHLINNDYKVTKAFDGEEALMELKHRKYDLALVDIMMPKLNGFELITEVRRWSNIPIIILSAKDQETDKVLGLGFGADDYITKPFSLVELTARVQAALRRNKKYSMEFSKEEKVFSEGKLYINFENYMVKNNGVEVKLTVKEFEILSLLVKNKDKVFSKERIYESVWGEEAIGEEKIINVHIRRIREKIEEDSNNPKFIKTIWGIGYKFEGTK
ncbi:response regulator transcription factor [Clostridium sp.]|uniref:response regulator transcription factor n=1 Tax=Clostridium sp. TaxID=1506 RepID=UPI0039955E84